MSRERIEKIIPEITNMMPENQWMELIANKLEDLNLSCGLKIDKIHELQGDLKNEKLSKKAAWLTMDQDEKTISKMKVLLESVNEHAETCAVFICTCFYKKIRRYIDGRSTRI